MATYYLVLLFNTSKIYFVVSKLKNTEICKMFTIELFNLNVKKVLYS